MVRIQSMVPYGDMNLAYTMRSVPVSNMVNAIGNITTQINNKMTYDQIVASERTSASSSGSNDDALLIIGLVACVAIVVIGASYIMVNRKKNKGP